VVGVPVIAPSARRHGLTDRDIVHAYDHPIQVFDLDDGLTMLMGPNPAGALMEIGVVGSQTGPVVVHAMRARPKFLRR